MKIVFVGIHNKPGLKPLDSSTVTGKIVDEIISHFPDVEFEKQNIFPVDYLPLEAEERAKYLDAFKIEPGTHYIGLGKIPGESLSFITENTSRVFHPSFVNRKGKRFKKEWMTLMRRHINHILKSK